MTFEELWQEQEEINALGHQNIGKFSANRIYMKGYNDAVNRFESEFIDKQRVKEAIDKVFGNHPGGDSVYYQELLNELRL